MTQNPEQIARDKIDADLLQCDYVANSFHVEKADFALDPFGKKRRPGINVAVVWR